MRTSRKGASYEAALIVVFLAIAVIALIFLYQAPRPQPAARISANITGFGAYIGQSTQFPVGITNNGGDANNVQLTLSSPAFGTVKVGPLNVGGGQDVETSGVISLSDVTNNWYQVSVSCSYSDSSGSHTEQLSGFSVYAIPKLGLTNFAWEGANILSAGKDSIHSTDQTSFTIQVQSQSASQIYTGLSLSAKFTGQTEGLTISPVSQSVNDLGPLGVSAKYTFTVQSNGSPNGQYHITVYAQAGGFDVAQHTVVLTVGP